MNAQRFCDERAYQEAYRGRRVCVTGGAGFIGSHLVDALAAHEAEVTVLDNLSTGRIENLDGCRERVRLVDGSILDDRALSDALDGAEVVFHLAAATSVTGSVADPAFYHEVNCTGTLRVLEAMRSAGEGRIVFAASSSAYGEQPQSPKVETMCSDAHSPYAATKHYGESILAAYTRCFGLTGVSLRYFNIFGPRQRADSAYAAAIPRFIDDMLAGRRPTIFGDGHQTRDFTGVANAVHANMLAGAFPGPLRGDVLNVAMGQQRSVLDMATTIARLLKVEPDFDFQPPRVGDVMHSVASIEAAAKCIGYEPVRDFESSLADTLSYHRAESTAK